MRIEKFLFVLLVVFIIFGLSCASQIILNDKQPISTPLTEETPEIPVDDFTERLQSVQTGNFDFVYAFRRKDGDIFTGEDKKYLKDNSPIETNQWVLTGDKKAVIAGSNYLFTLENIEALKKRFKIEDYSPPKDEPKKEQNTKVNR
jgi:hypothetical protein